MHGDGDERGRYQRERYRVWHSDAVHDTRGTDRCDCDQWSERPGSGVMDCASINRWQRDLFIHCDGFTRWCELHGSYYIMHRHWSHERDELHIHGLSDER